MQNILFAAQHLILGNAKQLVQNEFNIGETRMYFLHWLQVYKYRKIFLPFLESAFDAKSMKMPLNSDGQTY